MPLLSSTEVVLWYEGRWRRMADPGSKNPAVEQRKDLSHESDEKATADAGLTKKSWTATVV